MGFYLDGEYVNDEYYRTLLKDNETTITTASDLTSLKEIEAGNAFLSSLLEKLGVELESYSTSELLDNYIECLGDDELDLQMISLHLNKEYFQTILYLMKEGKITQSELQNLFYSRSYQTRKEQIFSLLVDEEDDSSVVDIFAPLKAFAKQLTNYQNQIEYSETEISEIPDSLR